MKRLSLFAKRKEPTSSSSMIGASLGEKEKLPTRFTDYKILASNEIRLIELLPGAEGTTIELNVVDNVRLGETPYYNALSYTWGNPNITQSVLINGLKVELTKDLVAFLHCRRRELGVQVDVLWVDAICINQQDGVEKTQQLPLMRQIYSQSATTIVWLGVAAESDKCEKVLELVQSYSEGVPRGYEKYGFDNVELTAWLRDEGNQALLRDSWMAFVKLMSRPWFSRVWTIQEFILSPSVTARCGDHHFRLLQLRHVSMMAAHPLFLGFMEEIVKGEDEYTKRLEFVNLRRSGDHLSALSSGWRRQKNNTIEPLPALVWQFRNNGATDPRDKIYSLLGLTSEEKINGGRKGPTELGYNPQFLIVDYKVSAVDIYVSFAKSIIETTHKLDIICASQKRNRMSGLPTWTPDWSQCWFARGLLLHKFVDPSSQLTGSKFCAAGSTNTISYFSKDSMVLSAKGIRVDRITETWDRIFKFADGNWVIDSQNCMFKYPEYAQRWLKKQPNGIFKTEEDIARAHWMSLLAFQDFEDESFDGQNSFTRYKDWIAGSSTEPWPFVRTTGPGMQGRLTMVSKKGYVICGPENAQAGDILCVLFGCSAPVLLRPHWKHWEFVGECYGRGLMNGEIINASKAGADVLEEFDIA